jgi:ApaG protein
MVSAISKGVQINVEVFYQSEYSNPVLDEYMFAYKITIANQNNFPIQLLRRHWHIFDSHCNVREVEGEGVIGVQPVIQPNESYTYVSGCNLKTDIGKMHGKYYMQNQFTKSYFEVNIPSFEMVYPFKFN